MNTEFIKAGVFAAIGFALAWWIQGLNVTAAEQLHTKYVQQQTQEAQDREDAADKKRADDEKLINAMVKELSNEIESGEVFRRCVAAGKCGSRRVPDVSAGSKGIRLPPVSGEHADGGGSVPVAGEPAEEMIPVVGDCARVQLRLNRIQAEVEGQPGYANDR